MTKRTHSYPRDRGPFQSRPDFSPEQSLGSAKRRGSVDHFQPPVGSNLKKDVKYDKTNPFRGRGGIAVML